MVIPMFAMAPHTALLPRVVQAHHHRSVGSYGVLFSATAGGMVAGSLLWARWAPPRWRVAICFGSVGVNDIGIVVLALSPWHQLAVVAVWCGFWIGIGGAPWMTLITGLVPQHLRSRVLSFDYFGSFGLTPVGFVRAGAPATVVAPTAILAVGGTVVTILCFAPLSWRRARDVA